MIIDILNSNYDEYVTNNKNFVILDFGATNCAPCKILNNILEEIDKQYENITIGKINIEENIDIAVKFGIMSVPAIVFIKDNKIIEKVNGLKDKQYIEKIIEKNK
nr:thioredoxin family protein [uncultured Tyzzerella sp.]